MATFCHVDKTVTNDVHHKEPEVAYNKIKMVVSLVWDVNNNSVHRINNKSS